MQLTVRCICGQELIAEMKNKDVPATRPVIVCEPCVECMAQAKLETIENLDRELNRNE